MFKLYLLKNVLFVVILQTELGANSQDSVLIGSNGRPSNIQSISNLNIFVMKHT